MMLYESPRMVARRKWEALNDEMPWDEMMSQPGYLLDTPNHFAVAWVRELTVWDEDNEPAGSDLCWFIPVVVGDMRYLLQHIPFWLPSIAFQRRLRGDLAIRAYCFTKFWNRVYGSQIPLPPIHAGLADAIRTAAS